MLVLALQCSAQHVGALKGFPSLIVVDNGNSECAVTTTLGPPPKTRRQLWLVMTSTCYMTNDDGKSLFGVAGLSGLIVFICGIVYLDSRL